MFLVLVLIFIFATCRQETATYDVVLEGGRVIDPESGLDAVRNVGIRGDTIAAISTEEIVATRTINAKGLVVAPGFIDLHRHLHTPDGYQVAALDGITMALDLEGGVPDIKRFLKVRIGQTPIHFGASTSHAAARTITWGGELQTSPFGPEAGIPPPLPSPITDEAASQEKLQQIISRLRKEMEAGALGVGLLLGYIPGATRQEVIEVFRIAATAGAPVFVHARSSGIMEPGSSIEALTELIGAAAISGASLHIAHINSTCLKQSLECITLIEGAIDRSLDITTETYPYTVAMAPVNSTYFDPGWQQRLGIDYGDLELPDSGERLTKNRFEQLRASVDPIFVLAHLNPEEVVTALVEHPLVIIASDALAGHPRAAGTYARILGKYVRTQGTLSLSEAVRKISYLPALRLEKITSLGNRLGRVQVGAQADLVVFDAETVEDRATFAESLEPSIGIQYLLVAGTVVVDQGGIVKDATPGRSVIRDIF
jgi:N-acyl-D-aspartate/D-glutamate deacylase